MSEHPRGRAPGCRSFSAPAPLTARSGGGGRFASAHLGLSPREGALLTVYLLLLISIAAGLLGGCAGGYEHPLMGENGPTLRVVG